MRVPETLTHVSNVVKKVILQENVLMNKKMVATVGKGWAGVSIIKEKGLKDVLIVNRKIICLEIAQSQMIDQKVASIANKKGCYNCKAEDHMSRDCPEPNDRPKGCFNCK